MTELLNYVAGADAIAERDSLIDETLGQLGEELQVGEERLEELCEMLSIPLVLGRETRLKTEDYSALRREANEAEERKGRGRSTPW